MQTETICMYLPDEAVDVWRPVQAEKLGANAKPNLSRAYSVQKCECPLQPTDVPKADGLLPAHSGHETALGFNVREGDEELKALPSVSGRFEPAYSAASNAQQGYNGDCYTFLT